MITLRHTVFVSREFPPSFRAGGIATYVKEIGEALIQEGVQVTIICASDNTYEESTYIENGMTIIRLSGGDFYVPQLEKNPFFIKKLRFAYRFFSYRYKIKKTIQHLENVSLIEVAEFGAEGIFLLSLKTPLVVRLHVPYLYNRKTNNITSIAFQNFHNYWMGLLEFYIVKKSKYITACSNNLKNWFVEQLQIPPDKIKTSYNLIDTARLPIQDKQRPIALKQSNTIFYSGSLLEAKGICELIAAVKILRAKKIDISLCLAGKMTSFAFPFLKQAKQEDWHWCTFLGHINRNELYEYYSSSTLCCFPSWYEGLPYTCLEAMGLGAIVIGSSNGGMAEIIENGQNGFLCTPLNTPLLAQTIEVVLKLNEKQRNSISQNAIVTIQTKFSKEVIINQMIDYYMLCTE